MGTVQCSIFHFHSSEGHSSQVKAEMGLKADVILLSLNPLAKQAV